MNQRNQPKSILFPDLVAWLIDYLNSPKATLEFRELMLELTLLQKMRTGQKKKTAPWTPAELNYIARVNRRLGASTSAPLIFDQLDALHDAIQRKMSKYQGYLTFNLSAHWSGEIVDNFHFAKIVSEEEQWAMRALISVVKEQAIDRIICCRQCKTWAFRKRGAIYCSQTCNYAHYEKTERGRAARLRAVRDYHSRNN